MTKGISRWVCAIWAVALCVSVVVPAGADITWTGSLSPADPTTWDPDTWAYIGKYTPGGTLSITGGSVVDDLYGYIADGAGTTRIRRIPAMLRACGFEQT